MNIIELYFDHRLTHAEEEVAKMKKEVESDTFALLEKTKMENILAKLDEMEGRLKAAARINLTYRSNVRAKQSNVAAFHKIKPKLEALLIDEAPARSAIQESDTDEEITQAASYIDYYSGYNAEISLAIQAINSGIEQEEKDIVTLMNRTLKEWQRETDFEILLDIGENFGKDYPLNIIDVSVKPLSFVIDEVANPIQGVAKEVYEIEFDGLGKLNIFDSTTGCLPFFGGYRAYYKDYETLVIKPFNNRDIQLTMAERYFTHLELKERLTENAPEFFEAFVAKETEKARSKVREYVASLYGWNNEEISIHLNGHFINIGFQNRTGCLLMPVSELPPQKKMR